MKHDAVLITGPKKYIMNYEYPITNDDALPLFMVRLPLSSFALNTIVYFDVLAKKVILS